MTKISSIEGNVYIAPTKEMIMVVHEVDNSKECMCTMLPAVEPYPQFPVPVDMLKDFKYIGNPSRTIFGYKSIIYVGHLS